MEGGAELLDGVGDAGEAGHGAGGLEVAADDDGVLAAHEHAELLGGHVCFGELATSLDVYTWCVHVLHAHPAQEGLDATCRGGAAGGGGVRAGVVVGVV